MPCSHLPPADAPDALRVDDAHLTETVLLLARGIAADLGFDRLPILADALEDAGCDNFALLNHLRSDEPHRVECWALRRLLRTTLMLPGGVPMTFSYCPPGSFLMGSEDPDAEEDESPVHRVTLTKGFYAGVYPVTERQWRVVMGLEQREAEGDEFPVVEVTWVEAQQFCRKASEWTGRAFRLPTEAEWEYACRAGTTTKFHFGDFFRTEFALIGRYTSEYGADCGRLGVVGQFPPNPWGIFDCHGNVFEWCSDWYGRDYYRESPSHDPEGAPVGRSKVTRGGTNRVDPPDCTSAVRVDAEPGDCGLDLGFRVVFTA